MSAASSVVHQGPGAARTRPTPPARPAMSLETPAPVVRDVPRTRVISFARLAWFASFGLGTAAILFAAFSSGERIAALESAVTGLAPDESTGTVSALAAITFWPALGLLALVTIVESIVVAVILRGRGGPRWALLPIVVVAHVGAILLADAFVVVNEAGMPLLGLFILQWVVMAAGTAVSLLPDAGDWFREKREARSAPSAVGSE
ncbi:hypothetical protein [Pseudoclavibacter endophyticus]|uniref:Uncharacterized protein n=1 Tax=Pseudoclavibacter endophyticus TaxID=1778590 RepID=A0A6H9WQL9_9MICO|nr:hypothetical protein [Pseudoclavibacter endophyticus]KAB1648345.1 hypothetical protein F8O04_11660 [Pseudoclavibacter endophyticus]